MKPRLYRGGRPVGQTKSERREGLGRSNARAREDSGALMMAVGRRRVRGRGRSMNFFTRWWLGNRIAGDGATQKLYGVVLKECGGFFCGRKWGDGSTGRWGCRE